MDATFHGQLTLLQATVGAKFSLVGMMAGGAAGAWVKALAHGPHDFARYLPRTPVRAVALGALLGVNTLFKFRSEEEVHTFTLGGPFSSRWTPDEIE